MSWYHRCTILSISVVSVCLVLFTGCGGFSTGNGSGAITPTSKPATAPTLASTLSPVIAITAIPQGPAHKLGEEVKVGNLCVATLTAVKTSNGDAVTQP